MNAPAEEREVDGIEVLAIASDELEALLAPDAGMVICSLRHRGEELLGQRRGLRGYVEQRSTMGIPLLYPWANRLGATRFELAGREVDLDRAEPPPKPDSLGLPMHGLLTAASGWRVDEHNRGRLRASFDFGAEAGLVAGFPFPHLLRYGVALHGLRLAITTTVEASEGSPVPIAFGYHPYFQLPGTPRDEWHVGLPVSEHLELDDRMLPTGAREQVEIAPGPLAGRSFDDGYVAPEHGRPFTLSDSRRTIEVSFGEAYAYAQVYAPLDDQLIAFEPMTAPTNALLDGGPALRVLAPGERLQAEFTVTVRSGLSVRGATGR